MGVYYTGPQTLVHIHQGHMNFQIQNFVHFRKAAQCVHWMFRGTRFPGSGCHPTMELTDISPHVNSQIK